MKYHVEVFSTGTPIYMNVQLWIPGNPASVTSLPTMQVEPQPVYGGWTYHFSTYPWYYDVYSVRIYDNSGNGNDATVGDTMGSSDDFDYVPFGPTLNYDVTYTPVSAIPPPPPPPDPPTNNSAYILLY
ncbi:MAG: hypothetical protein U9R19_14615 [Bacteroidota bacterium]|nr:hypothetical protein [Bacteroidota bacterium]